MAVRTSTRGFRTWISGPGFQALNARFQDLALRTSVFGSQDLGFRTSKALHPTVVLSFSRHFSLRPVVTDGRTHGLHPISLSLSQSNLSLVRSLPGSSGISRALAAWFPNPTVRAESRFPNPTVRAGSAGGLKRGTVVSRHAQLLSSWDLYAHSKLE